MLLTNEPDKIPLPFASAGAKNTIPEASQIGITPGAASLTDGFPPLTRTPIAGGGVPPSGLDMNGILYEMSAVVRWANAGGGYVYDEIFATDVNVDGYPKGARILRSDGLGYWFNTVDDNITDPEGAGAVLAGWVPDFTTGAALVTMTSSNVTLTELEYGRPIIILSGLLTTNLNLIFPDIVGQWLVVNNCTGAYTVTAKTAAGSGVVLVQSAASKIYGDETNIYSAFAVSGDASLLTNIPAAQLTGDVPKAAMATNLNASGSAPFYVCRAWVNFDGTGTVSIRGSGNVSSITDTNVGQWTVNFTTALPDVNYSISGTIGTPTANTGGYIYLQTGNAPQTSSCAIGAIRDTAGVTDADYIFFQAYR